MGWWKINDNEVSGDSVADLMGDAIDKIVKEYEKEWRRKPTYNELFELFHFSLGHLDYLFKDGDPRKVKEEKEKEFIPVFGYV